MRRPGYVGLFVVAVCAVVLWQTRLDACPFCSAPSLTLSEQLAQADAVALVQWVKSEKSNSDDSLGATIYEVVRVVKLPPTTVGKQSASSSGLGPEVKKGDRISLAHTRDGKPGDLFLLTGSKGTQIEWASPLEVSETSFNYIVQSPSPEVPPRKRLEYFIRFLDFPDDLVANDAYAEFANAPYADIVAVAPKMPREQIRKWLADPKTLITRLGLYGLMLGLCGNEGDRQMMEKKILEPSQDYRLGIEGVMFGYTLLSGPKGLDLIEETKLKNKNVTFSETYAAMQSLRQVWAYGSDKIPKSRIEASMRVLLERPELAELAIPDLARWKDWGVQDRLMALYGTKAYDVGSVKRAIIRYLLACSKDMPKGENVPVPEHVAKARQNLEILGKKDPRLVRDAQKFFLP